MLDSVGRDSRRPPPGRHAAEAVLAGALLLGALAGCATRPPTPAPALPGWNDDDLAGLRDALARQCGLARPPPPWPRLCPEALAAGTDLRAWLARRMRPAALVGDDGEAVGLVTGYHELELTGSRRRLSERQTPLYRRPVASVLAGRPSRAQIERDGSLAGGELVWVDDPVEAFFLHVQGSGRVRLREGGEMRVGYAGDNGLPYRAIGATLVERGELAAGAADAQAIKDWLRAHPERANEVMRTNPRYVFFRELPPAAGDEGPPGSLGAPLTPLRSVAADPRRVPPGSLLYVETTWPADRRPLRRFVLAQDTGAAIRGAVRLDLFFGRGDAAARNAGAMRQPGRVWILRPVGAD